MSCLIIPTASHQNNLNYIEIRTLFLLKYGISNNLMLELVSRIYVFQFQRKLLTILRIIYSPSKGLNLIRQTDEFSALWFREERKDAWNKHLICIQ